MALALNWIIYGSDAHSKNYSLIHAPGSYLRLAPLYDVASHLPYDSNPKSTKRKLSMKIGGEYRLHRIDRESWRKFAEESGQDVAWVEGGVSLMVDKVEEHVVKVAEEISTEWDFEFIRDLRDLILDRVKVCRNSMMCRK